MNYDFDTVYDRTNSNSVKYMKHPHFPDAEGLIPMWVADMDFRTAPEIIDAMGEAARTGIFGYTLIDDEYYQLFIDWYQKRFGFSAERDWIVPVDGVLAGISAAISAVTEKDDPVLILQPVYFPFPGVIEENGRRVVVSELADGARYSIDLEDLEQKIVDHNVKTLLFCSPHNPVGRVWDETELSAVAELCQKHDVIVISDEIHSDLAFRKHIPFASLSEDAARRTITLVSVTKTFNLAAVHGADFIIQDPDLRSAIKAELQTRFTGSLTLFSIAAAKAAYRYGAAWLDELLPYLKGNIDYVASQLRDTKIKPIDMEGTYLMWLDCRALGMDDKELEEFFVRECGVWLNSGHTFGAGGSGFMRMNVACPRVTLEKAITRIRKALADRA